MATLENSGWKDSMKNYMEEYSNEKFLKKTALQHELIKPIQRAPRYRLYIREILDALAKEIAKSKKNNKKIAQETCKKAHAKISDILDEIN